MGASPRARPRPRGLLPGPSPRDDPPHALRLGCQRLEALYHKKATSAGEGRASSKGSQQRRVNS